MPCCVFAGFVFKAVFFVMRRKCLCVIMIGLTGHYG